MVQVKVSYGKDIRRMSFQSPLTFVDVTRTLQELYGLSARQMDAMTMSYLDGEGEWVRITRQEELATALDQHSEQQLMRLRLEKGPGLEDVVGMLQKPEVEAYVSKLVTGLMEQPNFDQLVQEMLPSVMSIMLDAGEGATPSGLHTVVSEEFSHSGFAEADPRSSITLPSISLDDVREEQPGLLLDDSESSCRSSDIFGDSAGTAETEELLEQIAGMLVEDENSVLESLSSPFSSLDFSAYSAMVEEDHVSVLLGKQADEERQEEQEEVTEEEREEETAEASHAAEKPQPDGSAETMTEDVLAGRESPLCNQRQTADAIARSFVLLEDTTSCAGTSEQYDEEELLQSLEELGFTNWGRNKSLLELFRGNLGMVVETLLNADP